MILEHVKRFLRKKIGRYNTNKPNLSTSNYPLSGSFCSSPGNYTRMYMGHEVRELFEETGIKVTKPLTSIINNLLTEYRKDIETMFDSTKIIANIYLDALERFHHYQDKVKVLQKIKTYEEKHERPPLFSDISKNVGLNEHALIPLLVELYGERSIGLVVENLPLQKVVTEEPYFQVDITPEGVEVLNEQETPETT